MAFRTVHPARLDQTSSSPSINSSSTPWKRASENSSKSLIAIQRSDQNSIWPFDPFIQPGSTRPHHHRESIPHPFHAKGHAETPVKVRWRSNGQIESYGPFESSIQPGSTRPDHHRESIPHPLYGKGHSETPVKVCSRSNGRIESFDPFEPSLKPCAPDLIITEYRFLIQCMEKGIQKLH